MWTGHKYFMENQLKTNKQKSKEGETKECLHSQHHKNEKCQEHSWGLDIEGRIAPALVYIAELHLPWSPHLWQ